MHPIVPGPQTLFAAVAAWSDCPDLIKMGTSLCHYILSANDDLTLLLPTAAQCLVELDQRQQLVSSRLRQAQLCIE